MHTMHRLRVLLMACVLIVFAAAFIAAECLPPTSTVGQCVNVGEREFCQGGSGDGGGGGGGTPVATPTQKPSDVFKLLVSGYSYNANSTTCQGDANAIDPISLIVRSWNSVEVKPHLIHHGLASEDGVGTQYFRGDFGCLVNYIGQASSGVASSRWHARGSNFTYTQDPYTGQDITPLTPHYDKLVVDVIPFYGCKLLAHVVPEDFYNDGQYLSGFTVARDRITNDWLSSGQHAVVNIYSFGNTQVLEQCNGERPQSDGTVYHIE